MVETLNCGWNNCRVSKVNSRVLISSIINIFILFGKYCQI